MLGKRRVISVLFAATALASGGVAVPSYAKNSLAPSVEINFEALEKLRKSRILTEKKSSSDALALSFNALKDKRVVVPVLRPESHGSYENKKVAKQGNIPAPKVKLVTPPAEIELPVINSEEIIVENEAPSPHRKEAIVVEKSPPPAEEVVLSEKPEAAELPEEKVPEEKRGMFSRMLSSVPFFSSDNEKSEAQADNGVKEENLAEGESLSDSPVENEKGTQSSEIYAKGDVEEFLDEKTTGGPAVAPLPKISGAAKKSENGVPTPHLKDSSEVKDAENIAAVAPVPQQREEKTIAKEEQRTPPQIIIIKPEREDAETQEIQQAEQKNPSVKTENNIHKSQEAIAREERELEDKRAAERLINEAMNNKQQEEEEKRASDEEWQNYLQQSQRQAQAVEALQNLAAPPELREEELSSETEAMEDNPIAAVNNPHELAHVNNEEAVAETPAPEEKIVEADNKEEAQTTPQTGENIEKESEISKAEEAPADVIDKSARAVQTSPIEPEIRKNSEVPPPVIKKNEEPGFMASLWNKLPFGGKEAEPSAQHNDVNNAKFAEENEEKTKATDAKLDEKLSDTKGMFDKRFVNSNTAPEKDESTIEIDTKVEQKLGEVIGSEKTEAAPENMAAEETPPPVPNIAMPSLEIAKIVPPSDISVTLKDDEKQVKKDTGAQSDSKILLSIAFDGNTIKMSDTDEKRLDEFVKDALTNGKRFKILSYARGVDGEVNSARRISLQRAIAVRSQMLKFGLEKSRITVQAIGNNPGDQEFANNVNIYELR